MSFVPEIPADAEQLSSQTFHVGGIGIKVFGLEHLEEKSKCNVAFLLHGRGSDADELYPAIWHLYKMGVFEPNNNETHLLLCTLDHRNHGTRIVDAVRNEGWPEGNLSHAQDMLSIQTGTALDISLVIDYFESVLFPHEEHSVDKWILMGASLGGHSTWIAGARDPRITHLVPIVGSPSMITLLKHRAATATPQIDFGPPLIPHSLLRTMKLTDPFEGDVNAYKGKSILVLSGAKDKLVNYVDGVRLPCCQLLNR